MPGFKRIVSLIGLAVVLLALVGPSRLLYDGWEFRGYLADVAPMSVTSAESFDWVVWGDDDGQIVAQFVFPRGPAAVGGMETGDRFYMLDNIQYFGVDDLRDAVRGVRPGQALSYLVERAGSYHEIEVRFTRFPTFLYPRSRALWQFALWGFAIGAFFHVLSLFVAAPLARRSEQARAEFVLIAVSTVWIVANLARLLTVEAFGPPVAGTPYDVVFQGLTLIGMVGWIGFPVLLLREVICGALDHPPTWIRLAVAIPPLLLAAALVTLTLVDHLGPITTDGLLQPILVYTSCYIGGAALIVIVSLRTGHAEAGGAFGGWGLMGSTIMVVATVSAALWVQNIVPLLDQIGEVPAGWLVVMAQLLAVAPVTMFSFGTLRHGKLDDVLSRALVYATVLGVIFFVFVGGFSLLDQYLGGPSYVLGGVFLVVVLLVFDRVVRRVRDVADMVLRTERQKARQLVVRLQERMPDVLEADALLMDVVSAVGRGLGARSAILFVQFSEPVSRWRSASFHPEPPYLTERVIQKIWPLFESDAKIWARNPELDARQLPPDVAGELAARGAAIAVPIRAEGRSRGLLVLGEKKRRRAVYNLEDVDVVRGLAAHLAVAADRLDLVERERKLARENTQAQLVALRAQINPHFLFNALNTILSHIGEQPQTAEAAVEHLAAIFRHTLQTEDKAFVTLKEELALVEHYLAIERARFGGNLQIAVSLGEGLDQTPVPAFCVQTLVENAVKHGIERRRGGGKLAVTARQSDGGAEVEVKDTGIGIPALFARPEPTTAQEDFFGIGLRNVHARMELLYNRKDLLRMESHPETGTVVTLVVPASVEFGNGIPRSSSNEPIST